MSVFPFIKSNQSVQRTAGLRCGWFVSQRPAVADFSVRRLWKALGQSREPMNKVASFLTVQAHADLLAICGVIKLEQYVRSGCIQGAAVGIAVCEWFFQHVVSILQSPNQPDAANRVGLSGWRIFSVVHKFSRPATSLLICRPVYDPGCST